MTPNRSLVTLFSLWLMPVVALSAEGGGAPWSTSLYLENDLFVDTDRGYTNGVGINWISPDLSDFSKDKENLPPWLRWLSGKLEGLHPTRQGEQRRLVVTLAQKIYTPDDPEPDFLLTEQRPYAGWLYLGIGFHERKGNELESAELNLGMVGPAALAKEAQDLVHDLRDLPRFHGWSHQLHNEPGIQYLYERKRKWVGEPLLDGDWRADLIGHAGFSLGNVATYANTGAEARFGFGLPDDFGTSSLRPGGNNGMPFPGKEHKGWGGHLFASADLRAVAYNITLDGNTFRDSHQVKRKPWVAEAALGASVTRGRWKLSFARVLRSKEYRGQADAHGYGSVTVSYTGLFD